VNTHRKLSVAASLLLVLSLALPVHAQDAAKAAARDAEDAADAAEKAQEAAEAAENVAKTTSVSIESLQKLLDEQKAQIENQKQQIETQQQQIAEQQEQIDKQNTVLAGFQTQLDQLAQAQSQAANEVKPERTEEEIALRERVASLEKSVSEIPQDPATLMGMETFPGSIRIPGTNAAFKFGGFAKFSLVKNFDPLVSKDRFIVGSIPVGDDLTEVQSETSLTANQSRLNFDVREETSVGKFRGFI